MRPPLRIAILECDTPLPKTKTKFGGYAGVHEFLLRSGARNSELVDADSGLIFSSYQVETNPEIYPDLEEIDAIVITGSRYDSFADSPWIKTLVDFTATVLAQGRVRVIGICFGHQIVARAMGVKVGRNPDGWEVAVSDITLTKKGKEIFGKDKLSLHQMHRDMAFSYPPGVEELGSSPVCQVQSMYAKGKLMTIQGHPEFDEEIMTEIVETRHAIGVFNDEALESAMEKVAKPHDGVLTAKAFLRFLLEE